jgi:hypothetical protein
MNADLAALLNGHEAQLRDPQQRRDLLAWACTNSKFELIALLLTHGADPDEPDARNQTPREYVRAALHPIELCTESELNQLHYILVLMGEAFDDYPPRWALQYAAGEGYLYGVQRLIHGRTAEERTAAIQHAELKLEEARRLWDTYSFIRHYLYENRTWLDEIEECIRALDKTLDFLDTVV